MPPTQQKALQLVEKNGALVVYNVPVPKPGKDEVLVKIYSSALNPVDWKIRTFEIMPVPYPAILGTDIAGEVVELGEGISTSQVDIGDRVLTQGLYTADNKQAGFQQYALVDVHTLAKVPTNLTYDEASTVPVCITAAYVSLYNASPIGLGFATPVDRENRGKYSGVPIVVLGGSSTVGHFAIQLAKLSGFSPIITTASLKNEQTLKRLGATHVLDRSAPITEAQLKNITDSPIKTIIDAISTAETQRVGFDILAPEGKQVLFLQPEPFWEKEGAKQNKTGIMVMGSKMFPHHLKLLKELYANLTGLLETGDIKPHHVEILPHGLYGIEAGLAKLEEGKVSATKLVARPQETA